jgi:hypothetical protein
MRVPGQKFFVPAIVCLFAGMARSYKLSPLLQIKSRTTLIARLCFLQTEFIASLSLGMLRLDLHQRFILHIHFTLTLAAARGVSFRRGGGDLRHGA